MQPIVSGDLYLEALVKFVENQAERLLEGSFVLKLNPVGLRYVQSRLEALAELESLLVGAPVDYLRAYVSDLGDHRALEQLRRILQLLPSLKVVCVVPPPDRDPTPLNLMPFGCLKVLELRGCDLSTSAAKGLVELRFTLEKLICHNSTNALRHVFATRIEEIKGSHQWKRLSFVSCACNGLDLMDEALQLLPAVECLDLSRNKFVYVDNLHKCTKLKHLDLGFNNLRSIASCREVPSQIVKLDLRHNALAKLDGIENLKSLEGLDLSYNIISNFSEVEILSDLPSLQNIWLEGNPLCCARWFRAQIFSLFPLPHTLKVDGKRITQCELWKWKIIVTSRMKRPSSFGFFIPAEDVTNLEVVNSKKKSISRVVSIESENNFSHICSDKDSMASDNEIPRIDENTFSEEEAEIEDLMKRIEVKKKKHSSLWLQELKEWMDKKSGRVIDNILHNSKRKKNNEDLGETSRCLAENIQQSGDDAVTTIPESETTPIAEDAASSGHSGEDVSVINNLSKNREDLVPFSDDLPVSLDAWDSRFDPLVARRNNASSENLILPSAGINNITGSHSSLVSGGSPPHFREDILHRRHNIEEEYLQLFAESLSGTSSDSKTSSDEDDSAEFG